MILISDCSAPLWEQIPSELGSLLLWAMPGPAASAEGKQAPTILLLAPYIIIFALFYMLLIAPARKRQQKTRDMLAGLKTGDRVVMTCGIHGTIVSIEGDMVQLRIADKVKIDVSKASIAGRQAEGGPKGGRS